MDTANSAYSELAEHLLKIIRHREATIGIIGMGYVGLPLAMRLPRIPSDGLLMSIL